MKTKLLAAAAALVSPLQLTFAELQDQYDESKTTVFQPDLVISAWGNWVVLVVILIVGSKAVADAKEAKDLVKKLNNQTP